MQWYKKPPTSCPTYRSYSQPRSLFAVGAGGYKGLCLPVLCTHTMQIHRHWAALLRCSFPVENGLFVHQLLFCFLTTQSSTSTRLACHFMESNPILPSGVELLCLCRNIPIFKFTREFTDSPNVPVFALALKRITGLPGAGGRDESLKTCKCNLIGAYQRMHVHTL